MPPSLYVPKPQLINRFFRGDLIKNPCENSLSRRRHHLLLKCLPPQLLNALTPDFVIICNHLLKQTMPTFTSPSVLNVGDRNILYRILDREVVCTQLKMDACSVHTLIQLYFHVRSSMVYDDMESDDDNSVIADRRELDECTPGTIPWFSSFGHILSKLSCVEKMYLHELDNHAALLCGFFLELTTSRYLTEVHFVDMDLSYPNYADWSNAVNFKHVIFQRCSIHVSLVDVFFKDEQAVTSNSCVLESITFIQCDLTKLTSLPNQLIFAERILEVPTLRLMGFCQCHYNDDNQRTQIKEAMYRTFLGTSVEVLFDLEEPTTLTKTL